MTGYEVTEGVSRMESVEAQFNISIEGLFAVMKGPDSGGEYEVTVNYEVISSGEGLVSDIDLIFVAYADNGQVLGWTTNSIWKEGFIGLAQVRHYMYCKKEPKRFRLYPIES